VPMVARVGHSTTQNIGGTPGGKMSASGPRRYWRLVIAICFAGLAASREVSEEGWRSKDTERGRFWFGGEEEGVPLVGGAGTQIGRQS
jgi:hypothetical protein